MNYAERTAALASTLEADGYHMAIEEQDACISVTITAGPDACADCLVPKDLMRGILSQQLGIDGEHDRHHLPRRPARLLRREA